MVQTMDTFRCECVWAGSHVIVSYMSRALYKPSQKPIPRKANDINSNRWAGLTLCTILDKCASGGFRNRQDDSCERSRVCTTFRVLEAPPATGACARVSHDQVW